MFANRQKAVQFLRFCMVGVGNTAVDFSSFLLLTWMGIPYLLAQLFAYSAGGVNSFFFNRRWTFRVRRKVDRWEIMKFAILNGLSLLISSGLLLLFHDILQWNLWLGKLATTVVTTALTFIGSKLWVLEKHRMDEKRWGDANAHF